MLTILNGYAFLRAAIVIRFIFANNPLQQNNINKDNKNISMNLAKYFCKKDKSYNIYMVLSSNHRLRYITIVAATFSFANDSLKE